LTLAEIQLNPVKSISSEILLSRPWPKFGHIVPDRNLFESHPSSSLAEIWPRWPRQKNLPNSMVSALWTQVLKNLI